MGMEMDQNQMEREMAIQFGLTLIALVFSLSIFLWMSERRKLVPVCRKLPPSPPKLPVIGHLHHIIGSLPHHYPLRDLARKCGPLMHLKFGEVSTVVVSSPEFAKMVLRTHDTACADRPNTVASQIMWYGNTDIVFSPYGHYWRQMRRICASELLSAKNVRSFDYIRMDEASLLIDSIRSTCGAPFDLSENIFMFMNSMTCRATFGKAGMDRAAAVSLLKKAICLAGHFDLADVFPSIKLFNLITWNKFKLLKLRLELDKILDDVIHEHMDHRHSTKTGFGELGTEDLVDVLLRFKESGEAGISITNNGIKSVIFDMFSAGTETSSTTVEWAMAELMRNPRVMAKAQDEVRQALMGKEAAPPALRYLKMVIKETLRLHPPISIIPRTCREEFEMEGYHIPLKANVIVNIWSIGRDPKYWHDPERFEPERFENSSTSQSDFMGSHSFEYIPFGSGKRMCPGMAFGVANVEFLLRQLLYHFDWKLPSGMGADDLDMTEVDGIAVSRKTSLRLIAASPIELTS